VASTVPIEIRRVEDREIHVTWADGHRSVYGNKDLRERCPCAGCVHELTGARLLDPRTIRTDIRAEEIALVGRYAIRIRWSDGHATGLFTFQRLREWCPCAECRGAGATGPA
jgi:DUF971 family protein